MPGCIYKIICNRYCYGSCVGCGVWGVGMHACTWWLNPQEPQHADHQPVRLVVCCCVETVPWILLSFTFNTRRRAHEEPMSVNSRNHKTRFAAASIIVRHAPPNYAYTVSGPHKRTMCHYVTKCGRRRLQNVKQPRLTSDQRQMSLETSS